ncbi:MAG TPA: glycosyltransferase family 39 protein [Anaerolineales bacterium]|nr:glycosyltransferase family 39 protein [Anaerolineales bacterium]
MPRLSRLALLLTFLLALGIRLYDLTDPPFDFHSTRQFRSAVIARGMYYARLPSASEPLRSLAIQQWHDEKQLEPPILEGLVSLTYFLPGGEALWKARLLSLCFWVAGGVALYALLKKLLDSSAAWLGTLVYLFLPYGVFASRSFQPDPLMVSLTIFAIWRIYEWHTARTWKNALLAGGLAGAAILIKAVALFPIGCVALALIGWDAGWKKSLRDGQTWAVGLLALAPGGLYYIYGLFIAGFLQGQAAQSFLPNLWLTTKYYLHWAGLGVQVAGLGTLLLGGVGIFFWPTRSGRVLALGWGVGYLLYGFAFPYHIMTHDYYQLPLLPLVAFSITPLLAWGMSRLPARWGTLAFTLLAVVWVGFQMREAYAELSRKSYVSDAQEWSRYQTLIPPDQNLLALVQAYGYPLKYYGWRTATLWANTGDVALRELAGQSQFEEKRWEQFDGMDLFLVTNFNEFDRQPELKEHLTTRFGVFAEGEGFVIYDLKAPLE